MRMTPVKIDKSVINRMEIRELKDEIARLKQNNNDCETSNARLQEEIARLKKIEKRLGADIGLIEQIDELEAKLDLVQVENGELKKEKSRLIDLLFGTLCQPDRCKNWEEDPESRIGGEDPSSSCICYDSDRYYKNGEMSCFEWNEKQCNQDCSLLDLTCEAEKERDELKALLHTTRENAQTQIFDLQQEIVKFKQMLSGVLDDDE